MRSPLPALRSVAALTALLLALAACGSDDASEAAPDVPDGSTSSTAADEGADDGTRVVSTVRGDVEIPTDPQRIVVDWVTFDNLGALDADRSAVADVFELEFFLDNPTLSPVLTAAAAELDLPAQSGSTYELNAEGLAALDPDLILMAEDQAAEDDVLAILDEIAPVVIYDLPEGDKSFAQWQSGLTSLAEVLGGDAPGLAEARIAEFDEELAAVQERHAGVIDTLEVSTGNIAEDSVTLSMPGRNIGTEVAQSLGLARPAAQLDLEVSEYDTVSLSPEQLALLDADILFLEQRQDDVAVLEANPLFQGLAAVTSGNVVFVPNHWEFGGAGAAMLVLDEMDAAIERFAASAP